MKSFFIEFGLATRFSGRFFRELFSLPFEFKEFLRQAYFIGNKSVGVVIFTGLVIGVILVLQSRPALIEFGAGSYLPSMSALSVIREVGPLICSLICAGKFSSSFCAEIGSMRVTEQIDAMEVSGNNPFKFLVVTRVIALTLMLPALVVIADITALMGAFVGANINGEISFNLFFIQVIEKLEFSDLFPSMIKCFFFGWAIGIIGCFKGFYATSGTAGVGRATNSAVVIALVSVIFIDMIAVQLTNLIFNG